MVRTVDAAVERGVSIGAQVSYPDLVGFGRRDMDLAPHEIVADVLYQLGALDGMARAAGSRVSYVKPHAFRLSLGIVLLAFVALAEGAVALMLKFAFDYVLNPSSSDSKPPLITLPNGHVIYLNDFFPAHIHNVWTMVAVGMNKAADEMSNRAIDERL